MWVREIRGPLKREWKVIYDGDVSEVTADAGPHAEFITDDLLEQLKEAESGGDE